MKYGTTHSIAVSGGAFGSYIFRANGLWDPDFTGTGHQPYYFDQLAAIYGKYCVHGCRVKATFVSDVSGVGSFNTLVIRPDYVSGAGVASTGEAVERYRAAYGIATYPQPLTLTASRTVQELTGLSVAEQLATEELCALVTTYPSKQLYVNLYNEAVDTASTNTTYVIVEMEFDCTFFDRLQPAASS